MERRGVQGPALIILELILIVFLVVVGFDAAGQLIGAPTLDNIVEQKDAGSWDPNAIFQNNPGPYEHDDGGEFLLVAGAVLGLIFILVFPWGALDGL